MSTRITSEKATTPRASQAPLSRHPLTAADHDADAPRLTMSGPPFLTIDEAAAMLRCSTKHLRRLVHRGVLPERRTSESRRGRLLFVAAELEALVRAHHPSNSPHETEQSLRPEVAGWAARMLGGTDHRRAN